MREPITQAMVLAAGLGTRLRPLTDVIPKPLCEVAGLPLIRFTLRQLQEAGVTRAVVNLHHLGGAIRAHLGPRAEGVDLNYSEEPVILGTGGGIRAALSHFGREPFYVVNSDALQDVDLAALARVHRESGALATLALRPDPDVLRYGPIGVDATGRIRRMIDGFDDGGATELLMFTGVHIQDARVVEHLPVGQEACVVRQGYLPALRRGAHLQGYRHPGAFHDVGTPARWLVAQREVLQGSHPVLLRRACGDAGEGPTTPRAGWRELAPGVWASGSTELDGEVRFTGPCVLHAGARVMRGASLGWTALGAGARVGAGAQLLRVALMAGAGVPDGAVVEDRVVSAKVALAWS
ncbi:MAG: nucleotidyltransferase family protein [Myxococcota bacterium]